MTVSDSLLSLFKNERPWTNCSSRSLKKSDSEEIPLFSFYAQKQIAPVALCSVALFKLKRNGSKSLLSHLEKRATVSELFLSLFEKSDKCDLLFFMSEWLFCSFAFLLFCSQKTSNSLKKPLSEFPTLHFLFVNQIFFPKLGRYLSKHPQGDNAMPCIFCGL